MAHFVLLLVLVVAVPSAARPRTQDFARTQGGLQADEKKAQATVEGDTSTFEIVGACRANCVEQTRPMEYPPTYDGCSEDPECTKCWNLCEHLFLDEMRFRPVCDDCSESIGCTSACKFSFTSVLMPESMPWEFDATPATTEVSDEVLHITWETPRPRPKEKKATPTGRPFLVYSLLFRDESNPHWSLVTQTLDSITQVTGPHSQFPGLQFLLLVSSPSGTVARDIPPYPVIVNTSPPVVTPARQVHNPKSHQAVKEELPIAKKLPATMSEVSVKVEIVNGRLEIVLNWQQEINTEDRLYYAVRWGRQSCNVDIRMPHCPLTDESIMEANIPAKDKKQMRLILTQISFNSEYWLEVGFERFGEMFKTVFYTPSCPRVDATFEYCLPAETTTTTTTSTYKVSATVIPSTTRPTPATSTSNLAVDEKTLRQMWQKLVSPKESNMYLGLLALGVGLSTICILVVSILIYKYCCRRPDSSAELAKVLQSTTNLPLLDVTNTGSMASLHQLQRHNVLNGSPFSTPTQSRAIPTAGLLTPPVQMHPMAQNVPWWFSMEALQSGHPLATSASPAGVERHSWCPPVAPAHSTSNIQIHQQQQLQQQQVEFQQQPPFRAISNSDFPRTSTLERATPSKSRSMERLNENMGISLRVPTMTKRSISTSDISPTQPARRSINFTTEQKEAPKQEADCAMETDPMLGEEESECERVCNTSMSYYLRTVPEEKELIGDGPLTATDDMAWEYE